MAPLLRRLESRRGDGFATLGGDAENRSAGVVGKDDRAVAVPRAPERRRTSDASVFTDPPSMSMRLSLLSAKNPMDRLSGDQNGVIRARSLPTAAPTENPATAATTETGLRTWPRRQSSVHRAKSPAIASLVGGVLISSRASESVGAGRRAHTPIAAAISVTSARPTPRRAIVEILPAPARTRPSCCRSALDVVDFDARVGDVVQPALRIFLQTPPQQLANPRRRLRPAARPSRARVRESPRSCPRSSRPRTRHCPVSIS